MPTSARQAYIASMGSPTEKPPSASPSKSSAASSSAWAAAEIHVGRALDDSEERLPARARCGERALGPAAGLRHRGFDHRARRLTGRADIELHLDVGAEQALHAHRLLGREVVLREPSRCERKVNPSSSGVTSARAALVGAAAPFAAFAAPSEKA